MATDHSERTRRGVRREFLRNALVAGGAAALAGPAIAAPAGAGQPANQPPNVPDWTRFPRRRRRGSQIRQAVEHETRVLRRDVEWLTATPQSSVSFTPLHELDGAMTPNGLCFERHHAGIAEIDPADYPLMLTAWSTGR